MSKKVIKLELSEQGIDKALNELLSYKKSFNDKLNLLREKVGERLKNKAQNSFNSAIVDDIVNGAARYGDVTVKVVNEGNKVVVVADGTDAVWIEFGAGVYHNGAVGNSPNPHGVELGLTIGSYGKGKGKQPTWGYLDEDGDLVLTHGTPATMPMTRAVTEVSNDIIEIAREVFK